MRDERLSSSTPGTRAVDRSSRRRVLAGVGAGLAATVAGCSGILDSSPVYEYGADVDADGDARTAEEFAAAEAAAEREPDRSVTRLDAISVDSHEFALEDDFKGSTVQGLLENTGDERIQLVEVRVRVFDDDGDRLGLYVATTGDLESGSSWAFQVVLLEAPDDVAAYELAALGSSE